MPYTVELEMEIIDNFIKGNKKFRINALLSSHANLSNLSALHINKGYISYDNVQQVKFYLILFKEIKYLMIYCILTECPDCWL